MILIAEGYALDSERINNTPEAAEALIKAHFESIVNNFKTVLAGIPDGTDVKVLVDYETAQLGKVAENLTENSLSDDNGSQTDNDGSTSHIDIRKALIL